MYVNILSGYGQICKGRNYKILWNDRVEFFNQVVTWQDKMASASPKEKFDAAIRVIHSLPKDGLYVFKFINRNSCRSIADSYNLGMVLLF